MAAPDAAALAPFALPLRREADAVIADVNGQTVLIIDPSRNLDEDAAEHIADLVFACLTAAPVREEGGAVLALGTPVEVEFSEAEVGKQTLYVAGVDMAEPGMTEPEYWLSETWPVKCRGDVSTDWKRDMFSALATREEAPVSKNDYSPTKTIIEEAPAEAGDGKQLDRLFYGGGEYVRADEAVRQISALQAELSALRAQPQARSWGWDYEICTGCSASLTASDIKAGGHVSCCPDRRMVTVRDLVDAYEAQRKPQAREEARPVAWRGRDLDAFGDGAWAVCSFKPSCDVVEPLYTTPPAPEADKLRVAIETLRADEGASVTILCDDPEASSSDVAMAVECRDEWTDWQERRFYGRDVLDCLTKAVEARAAALQQEGRP